MIYPKESFTSELADEWLNNCFTTELAEQLCFNLLQHLSFAAEKTMEWINTDYPDKKSTGYRLLLRLILGKKPLPNLEVVKRVATTDCMSAHYQLRQQALRLLERLSLQ